MSEKSSNNKRLNQLRKLIAYHQERYHEEDAPEISDEAYDSLVKELQNLEGIKLSKKSVLNKVGGAPSQAFAKVTHKVRQWSLDNVFSVDELKDWEERLKRQLRDQEIKTKLTYVVEHKLDGLKLILEYREGKLFRAATRGDGVVGEDVTHTALMIRDVPHTLTQPLTLTCVGEVWLSEANFEKINEDRSKNDEPLFANPRNAAAGSLRQLDPEITRKRNLSMIVYDLDYLDSTNIVRPESQIEELKLLKKLGFHINDNNELVKDIKSVVAYYEKWQKRRESLPYGVDGVVVKVNEVKLQEQLGYTAKSPRFGVAFKFPAEQTTTIVEDIILQVGRTGVITPVAELRPTLVAGSTVSRATLHNEDQIKRLDIRIGDTVILQKAGDVIPEVVSVVLALRPDGTKPYRFPKKVVGCGGDGRIERIPGEAAYRCVTLESDFLHRQRLYYFVSKKALNIDGVGPRIIDLLLDQNLITEASDLFTLTEGDFLTLPGFKQKAADNAVRSISKAKTVPLHNLLIGLSIEHIGEETARLIAEYSGSLEGIKNASLEELIAIHGVGEIVAKSIYQWFKIEANQKRLDKLVPHLNIVLPKKRQAKTALTGKVMVFTGSLEGFSRDEAKDQARMAGATVASSVSKKTDYVVVGEDPGSKAAEAKKLGVNILTESEFKRLLGS